MDRRGFTLVEMLVTISILSIMTTMAIVNFRVSEYSDELRYAAVNLAAEIRRAQNFSLIGRPLEYCRHADELNGQFCSASDGSGCGDGQCVLDTPHGGYGIRISRGDGNRTALLFADTDSADRDGHFDHVYQSFEQVRRFDFVTGRNVTVTGFDPDDSSDFLDISFMAPRPIAWFNGRDDLSVATVTLTHAKTGQTRTVKVNGISGQVSVE